MFGIRFCSFSLLLLLLLLLAKESHGGASGFDYATPADELLDEYDFIIVGGGPSGSRVLEKLTNASHCERPYKVLLIEAGGNPPLWTDVPLFYLHTGSPRYSNLMWWFPHNSNGLHNLASSNPTVFGGKVLGGGSTFNGAALQRGCAKDFDRIETETQCTGWDFDNVLRAFKHDENNQDPNIRNNGFHGTKGTLCVNSLLLGNGEVGGYAAWKKALQLHGMQYADPHDGTCHGKGYHFQANYCHGQRYSAVTAFITPFFQARRSHMHIKLNTVVTKLIISNEVTNVPQVIGVETANAITREKERNFFVKKEVIVTAGALKTPQLLMVSGIGPAGHLRQHGITPLVNLPGVGENLHNHPGIQSFYVKGVPGSWLPNRTSSEIEKYFRHEPSSLLSSSVNMVGVAYHQLRRSCLTPGLDPEILKYNFADVEFTLSGANGFSGPSLPADQHLKDEYISGLANESFLTVNVYQMHQKSRGNVTLYTNSMFDSPHVFFNYFSVKSDLEAIAAGALKFIELLKSPPFASLGIQLYDKPFPNCKEYRLYSIDYLRCLVKQTTHANFHYAGTAKMSCNRQKDPLAVVDGRCRVYDVAGLRIADSSIAHALPQGHSMAYAYLTGARCADFILSDYKSN